MVVAKKKMEANLAKRFEMRLESDLTAKNLYRSAKQGGSLPPGREDRERRQHVVDTIKFSWNTYKDNAWGYDEYFPGTARSGKVRNWTPASGKPPKSHPVGATIIDALDTLILAGLHDEADEAIGWIRDRVNYTQVDGDVSVFETTIRILGGLLSSYQLKPNPTLLEHAKELADRLYPVFKDSRRGIPDNYVNLKTGQHHGAGWNSGAGILSEFGSLQLEFRTLSHLTGDPKYNKAVTDIMDVIRQRCVTPFCDRMWPQGYPSGQAAGLGSFGDSYYEYLLKQWLLTKKKDFKYLEMWSTAADHIIATSTIFALNPRVASIHTSGPLNASILIPNGQETGGLMEHLACFAGGLFALSYHHTGVESHLHMAEEIAETCHYMYKATVSGLAPDTATFGSGVMQVREAKYILRPETVETYFYLWRLTKNPKYRDWGYEVLLACEKHLKTKEGYVGAMRVDSLPVKGMGPMETFWMAETLKYMLLLFSDDGVIDIDRAVFNTEAHPFKMFDADVVSAGN